MRKRKEVSVTVEGRPYAEPVVGKQTLLQSIAEDRRDRSRLGEGEGEGEGEARSELMRLSHQISVA